MSLVIVVDGKAIEVPQAVEAEGPEAIGHHVAKHAPKKAHKHAPPEPAPKPEA